MEPPPVPSPSPKPRPPRPSQKFFKEIAPSGSSVFKGLPFLHILSALLIGLTLFPFTLLFFSPSFLPLCDGTLFFPLCKCAPGQGFELTFAALSSRTQCSLCRKNEYKPHTGNTACLKCPLYQETTNIGQTSCRACKSGHTRQRDTEGTASGSPSSPCRPCPKNSYLPDPHGTCLGCPVNHFSPEGSTQCQRCPPGHTRVGKSEECTPCPALTYFDGTACADCPVDTFSPPGSSTCAPCPANEVRPRYKPSCRPCERNLYKHPTKPGVCHTCGPFAFTQGPGKTSPQDCICLAGATRAGGGGGGGNDPSVCTRCPEATWKNTTGDGACTPVRPGWTTNEARDAEVQQSNWERAGSFVKKTGVPLFDATIGNIAHVGTWITFAAASLLDKGFRELLGSMYRSGGWESAEEFERDFNASGGAGNSSGWGRTEEDIPHSQRAQPCPFQNSTSVFLFMKKTPLYVEFEAARDKATAKALYRKLVLEFHVRVLWCSLSLSLTKSASCLGSLPRAGEHTHTPLPALRCPLLHRPYHPSFLYVQPDKFNNHYRACDDQISNEAFIKMKENFERRFG